MDRHAQRDPKHGQVRLAGYEITCNRCFHRRTPPRPLEEIETDNRSVDTDIVRMPADVTAGATASGPEPGRFSSLEMRATLVQNVGSCV